MQESKILELTTEWCDEINRMLTPSNTVLKKLAIARPKKPTKCLLPPEFIRKRDGIYCQIPIKKSQFTFDLFICSPLEILAFINDENSHGHGLLLSFNDYNGNEHRWVLRSEKLATEHGEEFRKCLMDMGLRIGVDQAPKILQKMFQQIPLLGPKYLCVSKPGWHHDAYILGNECFGSLAGDTYDGAFFPIEGHEPDYWGVSGTLNDWINGVSLPSIGNSRLVFSICMALSSTLLGPLNMESVGFNLFGRSSTGKTTLLFVANSVFGGKNRIQNWRGTSNGIEAITGPFNDTLICMDELAQVDPREAGSTAYMIGNGIGKMRANITGGPAVRRTWRLTVLSSGEIPLSDHVAAAGQKVKAGQLIRMVDIPAETRNGYGVFENLHSLSSGGEFSKILKNNANKYYGVAAREFLKLLTSHMTEWANYIDILTAEFKSNHVSSQADGQVERVADRFALIAATGEIASHMGITGWKKGEATTSVVQCFKDWIDYRGGIGDRETSEVLEHVKHFFELHAESRFSPWDANKYAPRTHSRAGYVRNENGYNCYYVFPQVFKEDICKGLNRKVVIDVLEKNGYLICKSVKEPHFITQSPEGKTARFYKIWRILDTPDSLEFQKESIHHAPLLCEAGGSSGM